MKEESSTGRPICQGGGKVGVRSKFYVVLVLFGWGEEMSTQQFV
jgi:hypothetical protein